MARRGPLARRARLWGDRAVASILIGALEAAGRLPPDRALDVAHGLGTRFGPMSGRHGLVLQSLAHSFPDMPRGERERIGRQMWGHQARLLVEAASMDRLFDWRPDTSGGRVELRDSLGIEARKARGGPTVFFTAHLGCFEMLPRLAAAAGIPMLVLFRPPNNRVLAERLLAQREASGTRFVPSRRGAAGPLFAEIADGGTVAVLVDQKFRRGRPIPFLGRDAPTNELVVRLAAKGDGSVVPARCVRLAGHRYRIDVEPPMPLVRNGDGAVDVDASLRLIQGRVEDWVREHPEQWMWFHRRWG